MTLANPRMQMASYKNHCSRKLENVKAFIKSHEGGVAPTDRGHFDWMVKALRVQFARLEATWDDISGSIVDDAGLFEELAEVAKTTKEAV